MPILHPNCFTPAHIQQVREQTRAQDPSLLERCILALELVGRLQQFGLPFVFKGGTSILLHLPSPKRLSIDVDIICQVPRENIETTLRQVVLESPFSGWNYQERREREQPPTKHFEVFFQSVVNPTIPGKIVLDVIHSDSPYRAVDQKELITGFIEPAENVRITVPTVSALLGDKLAAFAPETIGYPYEPLSRSGAPGIPRAANVVKHLFDIGELALLSENMEETIDTYHRVHGEQCTWRGAHPLPSCLDDSQRAAVWASEMVMSGETVDRVAFFKQGVRSVASHMFSEPFGRPEVRLAAGRTALLAEIVRLDARTYPLARFLSSSPNIPMIRQTQLSGSWEPLNAIRRSDSIAFSYWVEAQNLRR